MKILFCKISAMKYYKGACDSDIPYNGGSYVKEHGAGHEEYNFDLVELEGEFCCLGFVETKTTSRTGKRNDLHIEKIPDCELYKNKDSVDNVLVVWCATTDLNETSIVGWYKGATVYRRYQSYEFDNGYIQDYNIIAKKENCVLLPYRKRHKFMWDAPVAKKRGYGFGQSMLWYPAEEKAKDYLVKLAKQIEEYAEENDIDTYPED